MPVSFQKAISRNLFFRVWFSLPGEKKSMSISDYWVFSINQFLVKRKMMLRDKQDESEANYYSLTLPKSQKLLNPFKKFLVNSCVFSPHTQILLNSNCKELNMHEDLIFTVCTNLMQLNRFSFKFSMSI